MKEVIEAYIELLDEGTDTLRATAVLPHGDGFYTLLAPDNYDPEDEYWDFLPGAVVRLELGKLYNGEEVLVAKHPNPDAVRVWVESTEQYAPPMRATYALPVGDGIYELQPTPHYTEAQQWKFPPRAQVRLTQKHGAYRGYTYWLVTERVA